MALAPPAPTTTNAARKEIIRSVLDEITALARGHSELVDLTLTWAGGQTGQITTRRSLQRLEDLSYYPQLVATGNSVGKAHDSNARTAELMVRIPQ